MRFALGSPDQEEEGIMKKFNYRRFQEAIKIATAIVKLLRAIIELLEVAFNYKIKQIFPVRSALADVKVELQV